MRFVRVNAGVLFILTIQGCVSRGFNQSGENSDSDTLAAVSKAQSTPYCPSGYKLSISGLLCESTIDSVGPFTEHMKKECKSVYPDMATVCDEADVWPLKVAQKVVGDGPCFAGAIKQPNGLCKEGVNAFGPFDKKMVDRCHALVSERTSCERLRFEYSFAENILAKLNANADLLGGATYCEASWEEQPGYADYTTENSYLASIGQSVDYRLDRTQAQSLLGSNKFQDMSMCSRAKMLKKCVEKVTGSGTSAAALKFRNWAKGKVKPVEAHLAFAMQETHLGQVPDSCSSGSCNGIGLVQIITAFDSNGNVLDDRNQQWTGITHNVLTNLEHSARVLAEKTNYGASDLYQLAFHYNGNPSLQSSYATKVVSYYSQIVKCEL